ncbi:hypothetical protein M9H77_16568 [Catharanthus roseus]|uniref:Uncharacterized protein n=1 Tax=Catharanthus roseus TaxID=4058 RepID=A0ACC0B246_CATRO|nr:hypothetical protein M9H77_16568 [Catharanthus roseus]
MTVTLHDVELILGVPSYGNVISHYYSREQLIAVIRSDLDISDSSIDINGQDLAGVAESPRSRLSTEQRAACYVLYLLGIKKFRTYNFFLIKNNHIYFLFRATLAFQAAILC